MFLARKITRAKWEATQELSAGEISADAVTSDLRTQGNELSFWQCGMGAEPEVEEAVLAIAAAGDRVDRLDIVWLSDDELQADGQKWNETDGRTPVTELVRRHVDVSRLDYVRLGKIAHRVVTAIKGNRHLRLTKARVTTLLAAAVRQERIDLGNLQEKVRAEVRKSLDPVT